MNASQHPDILCDVYLEGEFIQTIRLDRLALPKPRTNDTVEEKPESINPVVSQRRRRSTIWLPRSGTVRIELDLRHMSDELSLTPGEKQTYSFDGSIGRIVSQFDRVTTYVYNSVGAVDSSSGEPPPDEPHIAE